MVIKDYYELLDVEAKKCFREKVINMTGMSYPTFYKKLRENGWTKGDTYVISQIIKDFDNA